MGKQGNLTASGKDLRVGQEQKIKTHFLLFMKLSHSSVVFCSAILFAWLFCSALSYWSFISVFFSFVQFSRLVLKTVLLFTSQMKINQRSLQMKQMSLSKLLLLLQMQHVPQRFLLVQNNHPRTLQPIIQLVPLQLNSSLAQCLMTPVKFIIQMSAKKTTSLSNDLIKRLSGQKDKFQHQ